MNKFLLFSISILLCSALAEALVCRLCKIYREGLDCTIGEATCEAEEEEQCKTITIFKRSVRHSSRQGCTYLLDKCGTTEDPMFSSVTTTYCYDSDFCKEYL